jgi:hypothetical protein
VSASRTYTATSPPPPEVAGTLTKMWDGSALVTRRERVWDGSTLVPARVNMS